MIYAANFKMNQTRQSTREYLMKLQLHHHKRKLGDRVIVFPSITAIDNYDVDFTIGVQNAYPDIKGAFTGEIGLEQLEEFDIKTILIGHSERREILNESQEFISRKFNFFKEQGFEIIYCIGEPLNVREEGESAVLDYLISQFDGIDLDYSKLIVAYEPVWAIGTGRSASIEEITNIHNRLKERIDRPILYGGSVKPSNIADIASIPSVDGVLVGSASLKVDSFLDILLH
ncbi:MAG: triose-phosphate isomerase [Epsilonproteobacteria bacterium]|nr:triose-phosphate isomerase [Campylobacterota bacterium]